MKRLIFQLIMILLPIMANANDSGTCGEHLTWTYVSETNTLTISGWGKMRNYDDNTIVPWFDYKNDLRKIIIEEGVTSIGNHAFSDFLHLWDVVIPNSVSIIGSNAFDGCSILPNVTIPSSVTSIGEKAFYGCINLKKVKVEMATPPTIKENAFSNCNAKLFVPKGSSVLYKAANYWKYFNVIQESFIIEFADPKVKEICITAGESGEDSWTWDTNGDRELSTEEAAEVQSLEGLFNNQPEITSFDEFQYFTGISEIEVHEGEGENSFWGCTNLKSIIIPNSVNFIGSTLREFLEFMIPETIIPGEGPFKGCTSLNSIYIPNSVTTIGDAAFRGCSALKSINIPNTVTSIGRAAFYNCI